MCVCVRARARACVRMCACVYERAYARNLVHVDCGEAFASSVLCLCACLHVHTRVCLRGSIHAGVDLICTTNMCWWAWGSSRAGGEKNLSRRHIERLKARAQLFFELQQNLVRLCLHRLERGDVLVCTQDRHRRPPVFDLLRARG
jgi:hypothetical protein